MEKIKNEKMTKSAEIYFIDGCGRCPLMATDKCKARTWQNEILELRRIVLECGLKEESKWGMPVYTQDGKNIVMVSAFKESASINFFKGALLNDFHSLMKAPGDNSQSARYVKFTELETIINNEEHLKNLIAQAIEVEKAGLKIEPKKASEYEVPVELEEMFEEMPELKKAFYSLTPGRQKAYLIFIGSAKQSATRIGRIEKYIPQILEGRGMYD